MSVQARVNRVTPAELSAMKGRGEKIAMLTAYDFAMATLLDRAGVDVMLVGDSAAMVMLGHDSTLPVTMDELLVFTRAVSRAVSGQRPMVLADMPFLSYQESADEAVRNAGRFLKEAGAHGVKVEGGAELAPLVKRMTLAGIPVMGHVGLKPQSVLLTGGYKVQGRKAEDAEAIMADALALEAAGAFAMLVECVPAALGERLTKALTIPTVGIGAGPGCDGQVLVLHDMLGLYDRISPKFVRTFADVGRAVEEGARDYVRAVKDGSFPAKPESFE